MKAGDLKHLITLQKPTYHTDSRGNRITTWQDVSSVYASMQDVSGKDFFAAQAHQAQDVITFGIRWRDDVTHQWRLIYQGKAHHIIQVNHLGYKKDFIHLKARLVTGEGV